jgi:hypothetical protein
VVTHASNIVEHPELIAERIIRFARLVGRENVIAGADCGFSSQAMYTTEVHPTVIWEKFKVMREGANIASRQPSRNERLDYRFIHKSIEIGLGSCMPSHTVLQSVPTMSVAYCVPTYCGRRSSVLLLASSMPAVFATYRTKASVRSYACRKKLASGL